MIKSVLGLGLGLVAGFGGSANAMTSADPASVHCLVKDAGKLPAGLSGDSVCAAIRAAAAPALAAAGAAGGTLSVHVTVISDSRITAAVTLARKPLPEPRVASSDRPLSAQSIQMLARAIAAEVAAHGQDRGA
jgi:hypothetical protein